ncbi:TPA: hypothetical protein ACP2QQ_004224 [Escherichia coli]
MLTKNDVLQKAIDLFEGNESAALNWCNEPNRALQWKINHLNDTFSLEPNMHGLGGNRGLVKAFSQHQL